MKTIPFGQFAGQAKYWPFFYLIPGALVYFWVLPLLLCLPWELKHIKSDLALLKQKFSRKKHASQDNQEENAHISNKK